MNDKDDKDDEILNTIDYWLGITDCDCQSKYPIGGCLKCDLLRIKKAYRALKGTK